MYAKSIQPEVKKETIRITVATVSGSLLMLLLFFLLPPLLSIPIRFESNVVLSGMFGAAASCLNFFFLGLTVQKAASAKTDKDAYRVMKSSYRLRTSSQLLWAILALVLPFFNGAAGILPLFIPGICIKAGHMLGILRKKGDEHKAYEL